jgi:hypothetical protein
MYRSAFLSLLVLAACDAVPATEGFVPPLSRPDGAPAASASTADADHSPEHDAAATLDEATKHEEPTPEPTPEPEATPDPALLAAAFGAPAPRPADLATGTAVATNVQLISTIGSAVPPRAILAVSGDEIVVEPGTFVEEHRFVVVSIEGDAVELAYFRPEGARAAMSLQTLQPLYRTAPPAPEPTPVLGGLVPIEDDEPEGTDPFALPEATPTPSADLPQDH